MIRNILSQDVNGYYVLTYQFKNSSHKWRIAFPWVGNNVQEVHEQKAITAGILLEYHQALQSFLTVSHITTCNEEVTREELCKSVDGVM